MITPGVYLMSWGGYVQRVQVHRQGGDLYFTTPTGYPHPVSTVPTATFTPVSDTAQ